MPLQSLICGLGGFVSKSDPRAWLLLHLTRYKRLAAGSHSFTVKAAGELDDTGRLMLSRVTWVVDLTAPVVSLTASVPLRHFSQPFNVTFHWSERVQTFAADQAS